MQHAGNGMPAVPYYSHRARAYPWARATIAAAEAEHGPPVPSCTCGRPLPLHRQGYPGARCETCEPVQAVVPPRAGQIHYLSRGHAACRNAAAPLMATADPRLVTCGICERTRACRDAAKEATSA